MYVLSGEDVPTPPSVLVEAHMICVFSLLNVQLNYLLKEIYILRT
jgi:hypothetical protein